MPIAISHSVAAVAWIVAAIFVTLNVKLLYGTLFGRQHTHNRHRPE